MARRRAYMQRLNTAIARRPTALGEAALMARRSHRGGGGALPRGPAAASAGPLLGIFACRQEHVRKMPGRVIGLTKDVKGHRAFCMTLQPREQDIRRGQ